MRNTPLREKLEILYENYGLETIFEVYDLDPIDVLDMLYKRGMIDPDDFFGEEDDAY